MEKAVECNIINKRDHQNASKTNRISISSREKVSVALVCLVILMQYIILLLRQTTPEKTTINTSSDYLSAAFFLCMFLICSLVIVINIKIRFGRVFAFVFVFAYLFLLTLKNAEGYIHLVATMGLLLALLFFTEIRFSRCVVRRICLFSLLCFGFLYFTSDYIGIYFNNKIFTECYINRNYMAALSILNMYMALTFCKKKGKKIRLCYILIYVAFLAIILKMTSRTSLFACLLTILFHIITVKKVRFNKISLYRFFGFILILSLISSLLISFVLPKYFGDVEILGRTFVSRRDYIQREIYNLLFKGGKWMFGNGFTEFNFSNIKNDAHNQWLQYLLNYGIIYLSFIIVVYFTVFKSVIRSGFSGHTAFYVLFQIVLFVLFVAESVNGHNNFQFLYMVFYLTNCKPQVAQLSSLRKKDTKRCE